jgi:hypothetical protein
LKRKHKATSVASSSVFILHVTTGTSTGQIFPCFSLASLGNCWNGTLTLNLATTAYFWIIIYKYSAIRGSIMSHHKKSQKTVIRTFSVKGTNTHTVSDVTCLENSPCMSYERISLQQQSICICTWSLFSLPCCVYMHFLMHIQQHDRKFCLQYCYDVSLVPMLCNEVTFMGCMLNTSLNAYSPHNVKNSVGSASSCVTRRSVAGMNPWVRKQGNGGSQG